MNTTPKSPAWTVAREDRSIQTGRPGGTRWCVRLDGRCMYTARTKREAVIVMERMKARGIELGRSEVA